MSQFRKLSQTIRHCQIHIFRVPKIAKIYLLHRGQGLVNCLTVNEDLANLIFMKIWKRLRAEHIFLDVVLSDKNMVLHFAADAFARDGIVKNAATLYDGMKAREGIMSTGIGDGIGIPHTSSWEAKDAAALLIRLAEPIDFAALDGFPVDIVLPLVIPENEMTLHLRILAAISRLCRNAEFCRAVRQIPEPVKLLEEIKNLEEQMAFH